MVSMATFGAFAGALTGNAQRISQEKKEGWIRQLRLTPLPANAYVIAKILVSLVTTGSAILIVVCCSATSTAASTCLAGNGRPSG